MRITKLIVTLAVGLCAGALNAPAGGIGFHAGICVPFVGVGFGFGLGGCGYPACGYGGCGYPCYPYACAQPAWDCDPPAGYGSPVATGPGFSNAARSPVWTPSTPGAGRWVPDPNPYRYEPGDQAAAAGAAQTAPATAPPRTVTITRSPEGVPLYVVNR